MAELLSQLPSEVDVGQLVADSTDVQDEEDTHSHNHGTKRTSSAGLVGALGKHRRCWSETFTTLEVNFEDFKAALDINKRGE